MLVAFLLLVIAAMALGILGIVVKGLFYLLFTDIGVLLVAFFLGALWMRGRSRRKGPRQVDHRAINPGQRRYITVSHGPLARQLTP